MNDSLEILDPTAYENWNEMLLATPGSSFFHTANWARVLQQSYGYRPLYFAKRNSGRLAALIPLMEVRSVLTGARGVSLPFTDYCEPILPDRCDGQELHDAIKDHARAARWKYVELRGGEALTPSQTPSSTFYRHVLDVSKPESALFASLRDSTKRNIKKAAKEGLTLAINQSSTALAEFYRLHGLTRQGHGVPVQPWHFFEQIYEHIIGKGLGNIVTAEHEGKVIAAAVYFHFGGHAIYKYGASDKAYQTLRPNNLVMWEAIKWYSANGYRSLCFGRTELHHAGLRQFKVGWGAEERALHYYKYDFARDAFVEEASKTASPYHKVMTRMPVSVLRLAGSLLYKHMG